MSLRLDDPNAGIEAPLPDDPTEPADMGPADRLDEIASILARGILRLHGRVLPEHSPTAGHQDRPPLDLELAAPSRPDGVAG
jgi:hypothetical protein